MKKFLGEMRIATGNEIAEHVIGPAMAIPPSHDKASYTQQQIVVNILWNVTIWVEDLCVRRMGGQEYVA